MSNDAFPPATKQPAARDEIVSYQKLRAFIGVTGLLLPVLAVLGCYLFGAGNDAWQISISHYFYSMMHIVFVCILCMLGGFLLTYQGKSPWESRLSNIAGFFAIGIAAFPTGFEGFLPDKDGPNQYLQLLNKVTGVWGKVHFGFAFALFICFIIFCLHYFQKPDDNYVGTELLKFKRRKRIYTICGWTIIFSIALIALFNFVIKPQKGLFVYSTFIFETTSLWAFGTAWLVKGSAVLKKLPGIKKMIEPIR
jgi:uncharacterized membrane protein